MKITDGKIRIMREELAKQGTPKDTDEIRENYNFGAFRSVITYHPRAETQNAHLHMITSETYHVLDGTVEAYFNGAWQPVNRRQILSFDKGEIHNIRTAPEGPNVTFPDATDKIGAISICYRFVDRDVIASPEEMDMLLNLDWFGESYLSDPTNKKSTPVLRADQKVQDQFWEILAKNKAKVNGLDNDVNYRKWLEAKK